MEKTTILETLHRWVNQRPRLEFSNYLYSDRRTSLKAWNAERRAILRDLNDARTLLRAVACNDSITAEALAAAFKHGYAGRLTLLPNGTLDYCVGQYWPTEYRKAACAVLASALWAQQSTSQPTGNDMCNYFRREFGIHIATRWFDWEPKRHGCGA